jgi:transcription initiation factor TFIID subunit 2
VKPRKIKVKEPQPTVVSSPDAPPPPYVDDGSHDILQEVLAIERQNTEKRMRTDKDKAPINGASTKRKKDDSGASSEDDILALAKPPKKERPSPPGTSTAVTKPRVVIPASSKPPPAQNARSNQKPDNVKPSVKEGPARISVKGKEKETSSSPAPTPKAQKDATPVIPTNEKKCREIIKALQKLPEAAIFSRPVDPIADGCPTYVSLVAS